MRKSFRHGNREQEAYQFDNMEALKNTIKLRYCLLPYLYSEYMKAALTDDMMFRPLAFDYPEDPFASKVEDQLLLGDGLMLCPVYQQNASGRYVYLPEDMLLITASGPDDIRFREMSAGHHYIEASLTEVVFFLRRGTSSSACTDRRKCKRSGSFSSDIDRVSEQSMYLHPVR